MAVRAFGDNSIGSGVAPTHIVLGFQWGTDADRFRKQMGERLRKFGLELHPEKTRRIEFGRYAEQNRKRRGDLRTKTDRLQLLLNVTNQITSNLKLR